MNDQELQYFIETQVNNQKDYRHSYLMAKFRKRQLRRREAYERLKELHPERYANVKKRVYKYKCDWKNYQSSSSSSSSSSSNIISFV